MLMKLSPLQNNEQKRLAKYNMTLFTCCPKAGPHFGKSEDYNYYIIGVKFQMLCKCVVDIFDRCLYTCMSTDNNTTLFRCKSQTSW